MLVETAFSVQLLQQEVTRIINHDKNVGAFFFFLRAGSTVVVFKHFEIIAQARDNRKGCQNVP